MWFSLCLARQPSPECSFSPAHTRTHTCAHARARMRIENIDSVCFFLLPGPGLAWPELAPGNIAKQKKQKSQTHTHTRAHACARTRVWVWKYSFFVLLVLRPILGQAWPGPACACLAQPGLAWAGLGSQAGLDRAKPCWSQPGQLAGRAAPGQAWLGWARPG